MKYLHNIRFGFATNSSSSHSVVLFNKLPKITEVFDNEEFGWNSFILKSEHSKRIYLAHQLSHQIARLHNLSYQDAALIASKWSGLDKLSREGYVDHNSRISFPYTIEFGKIEINKEFYNDLINYIIQPNIVIFGGNDNEPDEDIIRLINGSGGSDITNNIFNTLNGQTLARYDEMGNFWSLFNYNTGTKIRTSFYDGANVEKSEVPELVDLKITQYCESNCQFCYQGSNNKGKHANINDINDIIMSLSNLKVFEIAIGGGEPTQHPDFISIIKLIARFNIKPNFSTRNIEWVINHYNDIADSIGAIGISINHSYGLKDILCKLNNLSKLKFMLQIVVGSCSERELTELLKIAEVFEIPVLLLGWKYNNKGKTGPIHKVDLEKVLNSFYVTKYWEGPSISFDTVLVEQHLDWLSKHSHEFFFTKREGAHSMYIDAVKLKMAKSSFVNDVEMKDLDEPHNYSIDIRSFFVNI
jgi:hypothetical protein